MAMKKIKPQYGKVVPPAVNGVQETDKEPVQESEAMESEISSVASVGREDGQADNRSDAAAEMEESATATPKKMVAL